MTTRFWFGSVVGGLLVVALIAAPLAAQTAKASRLSDKELVALVQNAKTPADHEKLAVYYEGTSADLTEKATKHKELAAAYRRTPPLGSARYSNPTFPATHCENIAASAAKGAEEARSMAEYHRMLAKEAAAVR